MDQQALKDDTVGQRYDEFAQELQEAGDDVGRTSEAFSRYPDLFLDPSVEGPEDAFYQQVPISILATSTTMILLNWEIQTRHTLNPSVLPAFQMSSAPAGLAQAHTASIPTAPSVDVHPPIPCSAIHQQDSRKRGRSLLDYIGDIPHTRDKRVRFESGPDCPAERAFEGDLPVSSDKSPTVDFEQFTDLNYPHPRSFDANPNTDFGLDATPGFTPHLTGGTKAAIGSSSVFFSVFGANDLGLLDVTRSSYPAQVDQSPIRYQNVKLARGDKLKCHVPDNIKLPANMNFTMAEICCFLPKIFNRPKVMERALLNGFDCWTLAEMQMAAFDNYTYKDLDDANERFKQSKHRALKLLRGTGSQKAAKLQGRQDDLSAKDWKLRSDYVPDSKYRTEEQHMYLWEIYRPVDKPPTGNDLGEFTACLELWKENEDACPDLTTEDLEWLLDTLKDLGIMPELALNGYANHDKETLARFGKKSKKTASRLDPKKEK